MLQRCYDPRTNGYARYGRRGITVCAEWRKSFHTFLRDMGNRPQGAVLDRIDNEKGYSPRNCRWVSQARSALNRTNTIYVVLSGDRMPLLDACKKVGIPYLTAFRRLERGWNERRALSEPIRQSARWHA